MFLNYVISLPNVIWKNQEMDKEKMVGDGAGRGSKINQNINKSMGQNFVKDMEEIFRMVEKRDFIQVMK